MRVCVDPGHGGVWPDGDPGAVGSYDWGEAVEAEIVEDVADELCCELEGLGREVVVTRDRGGFLSLSARAEIANAVSADCFISVHANAAADAKVQGIETFHFPGSERGSALAREVQREMADRFTDHVDRGVKEANFTVLRRTAMPAILVECEFLTNPSMARWLLREETHRALAEAIALGVDRWWERDSGG